MPRYNAEQIYAFAREAGFSPDEATTMTAVALAESGGNSTSHATTGEDSRGLWQINAATHPDLAAEYDLWDPRQNALAARAVSHDGTDISPWTVTHHGVSARYLQFQQKAQAAAVAYGDEPGLGVWSGTAGYRHPLSAGHAGRAGTAADAGPPEHAHRTSDTSGADAVTLQESAGDVPGGAPEGDGIRLDELAAAAAGSDAGAGGTGIDLAAFNATGASTGGIAGAGRPAPGGPPADHTKLDTFLRKATGQAGDTYIYGVETKLDDPDPKAFDCSELVQWAAHQAGADVDDGAVYQYRQMQHAGTTMSVDQAVHTPGALLFYFDSDPKTTLPVHAHVAISLGDGRTIEARNPRKGVNIFDAGTNRFNYAAAIPGLSEPAVAAAPAVDAEFDGASTTINADELFDQRLGYDPDQLDQVAAPPDTHPADTHAADTYAADSHPADTHPADAHPPDAHGTDQHPPDTHPPDTHPGDIRPGDIRPADTHAADVDGDGFDDALAASIDGVHLGGAPAGGTHDAYDTGVHLDDAHHGGAAGGH